MNPWTPSCSSAKTIRTTRKVSKSESQKIVKSRKCERKVWEISYLEIGLEGVLVLLEPSVGLVGDVASIVGHSEGGVGLLETGLLVLGALALSVLSIELVDEGLVGGRGEHGLLIEEGEDTGGLGGNTINEVDGGLGVHSEVDELPLDLLGHVLVLLQRAY